jgi:hypothetical protein
MSPDVALLNRYKSDTDQGCLKARGAWFLFLSSD